MEGYILGNRYQIIEQIGSGGMAVVYKAKCNLLNRFVAVKILRKEVANDVEIVQRFRAEAQSAAKLSHPNIVSIYDVGEENDVFYIVMEYIDGITLKDTLDRFGALMPEETIDISIQIATALEHAHKNNIIHRDIKPGNIMITKDGIAKVTDFGIARATNNASTLTNLGNAIGSANYFSPEQAKGGFVDEKSDIYSLGVTMYQMATGSVPFSSESPISVAIQHLNDPAIPPMEKNSNCSLGLNNIIMKCIRKDPRNRYQSAEDLVEDLRILNADPSFIGQQMDDLESTKKFGKHQMSNYTKPPKKNIFEKMNLSAGEMTAKKKIMIGGIVFVAALVLFGIIFASFYRPQSGVKEFTLSNYTNLNYDDVTKQLAVDAPWLKIIKIEQASDTVETGVVVSQYPAAGQKIQENGSVSLKLTTSSGPETIKIPDFANKEYRLYKEEVALLGITLTESYDYSDSVAKDYVISVTPAVGSEVTKDSVVSVLISKGPKPVMVTVPNLVGEKYSNAVIMLKNSGLKVGTVTPSGTNIDNYIVSAQSVEANTSVNQKTSVDLTLTSYEIKSYSFDSSKLNVTEFPVDVIVKMKPSDTGKVTQILSGTYNETQFPIQIDNIKKPINGYVELIFYANGVECYSTTLS